MSQKIPLQILQGRTNVQHEIHTGAGISAKRNNGLPLGLIIGHHENPAQPDQPGNGPLDEIIRGLPRTREENF